MLVILRLYSPLEANQNAYRQIYSMLIEKDWNGEGSGLADLHMFRRS